MNKNLIIGIVALVLLIAGGAFLMRSQPAVPSEVMVEQDSSLTDEDSSVVQEEAMTPDGEESVEDDGEEAMTAEDAVVFEVDASNFKFSETEMKVNQGDKVRIVLKVSEGMHDWAVDEFDAKTSQITAGQTETVEFVADKKGTFEYYCSVGQHRQMGMVGTLIVE